MNILILIVSIVVVFLLLRFRTRMAAFVAWIVSSITGSKNKTPLQEETSKDKSSVPEEKAKPPKSLKVRQKQSTIPEEPVLQVSIEESANDVVKQTIAEALEEADASEEVRKRHKAFKASTKEPQRNQPEKLTKPQKKTKKPDIPIVDDSEPFVLVQNKRSSLKNKGDKTKLNEVKDEKRNFEPPLSLQKSQIKVASKNFIEEEASTVKLLENKESRKVVPVLSYAKVTSSDFSENSEVFIELGKDPVENTTKSEIENNEALVNTNGAESFDVVQPSSPVAQIIKNIELRIESSAHNGNNLSKLHGSNDHELLTETKQLSSSPVKEFPAKSETSPANDIILDAHSESTYCEKPTIENEQSFEHLNPEKTIVVEIPFTEGFEVIDSGEKKSQITKELSDETIHGETLTENTELLKNTSTIMPITSQVRVLTLKDNEHGQSTLYRLKKNWILQFRLGPSLLGRNIFLYTNYPAKNVPFTRNNYRQLKLVEEEGCKGSDDTAKYAEIEVNLAGSFHYYFKYADSSFDLPQGSGFFLVDPVLKYGNHEELPLDCIQCQTVISKNLGSFSTWEDKLRVSKESGYNMIHFTPIQALGVSNSAYSLKEQLTLNSRFDKKNGKKTTFDDIQQLVLKLRKDWKVTSICDIVLNHTANETPWLQDHPEATYNCQNCPYLRPAYLLDAAFHLFSVDVKNGVYENVGIPEVITSEDHLNAIKYQLHQTVLKNLKIDQLYTCDVNKYVSTFLDLARSTLPLKKEEIAVKEDELVLMQDPLYRRNLCNVDINLALQLFNVFRSDCFDEETRLKKCAEEFKRKLDQLNKNKSDEINDHLNAAVENVIAGIRYFRVQHDGPKLREITINDPLIHRYFTDHGLCLNIKEYEEVLFSEKSKFLMAHNGWVMNADPLKNFADSGSNVYLRRELIAWGDSVKLRYGDKPEDCPFLWQHMREYVEQTARIFDGVRLDNCHSTPILVAEYLLDCARMIHPDLYVVAELFTNSDLTDNIFVNRLGISSLIREAMSAWDSHEQGRLVYRYGGEPVGAFLQPHMRPLVPSIAHALFLDLSHDNPSPVEKRSLFDLLPSSALVSMACCASGSNRGYDELVPHHIHVVDENREYTEWTNEVQLPKTNRRYVTSTSGIIQAKKALNNLHLELGKNGFDQVYVDQMDPDIVAVTRHCPVSHQSYILVAFTAFQHPNEDAAAHQRSIKPLKVEGLLDEIVLEATLSKIDGPKYAKLESFVKDEKYINGLSDYEVTIKQHIQLSESAIFERVYTENPNMFRLNFKNFKPGSIVVIKVSLPEEMQKAVKEVRGLMKEFSISKNTELFKIINQMSLADLNRALYRCDQEERDEGHGFDTYNIPNFGKTVYAGIQGFMSLLEFIRPKNDLGHPMCCNLRDGNWMIDYVWQRLKLDEGTAQLGEWLQENTESLKQVPRYLIPCYFDMIVTGVYILLLEQSYSLLSDFVKNGSQFVKTLGLGSIQFGAYIKSAHLPVLSPNLKPPKPPTRKDKDGNIIQTCVTLSAGLPHFSVGYTRNWGRDTFIALRGLFILTGRFQEARYHILGYAACLRHGLIPNLLDGGRNSRFNCRDAVWWWLYCIKSYVEEAPNGVHILGDTVSRIFPTDDSPPQGPGAVEQTLAEIVQEALSVHFQGLAFRERNAGRQIDEHMSDKGFNNQIGIHPETGFVFGGNDANCGTWMDKMGSSHKAGNKGKPATPRDGSACELVGLSKAVITWLAVLNENKQYNYDGVERVHTNGKKTKWTFKEWAEKIQNNFEKHFWIDLETNNQERRPDLINKRGIYKDCYGASQEWTDYQLRCNFPIVMVVAPELFDPKHAWIALEKAEKHLLGPLGMKTLDPEDWAYEGYYDNSDDSDNPKTAHGFNYHQGPEWLWPVGYFLRAKLIFAEQNDKLVETVENTKTTLSKHFTELKLSDWKGLPELTNKDGAFCNDSSRTQAWSMSSILEVLHDLQKIESKL